MRIGQLDRRITILRPVVTKLGTGEEKVNWNTLTTVWCRVVYKNGTENYEADQKAANQFVEFTIRFREDITTSQRISFNAQMFEIRSVALVGRREGLRIMAEYKSNLP